MTRQRRVDAWRAAEDDVRSTRRARIRACVVLVAIAASAPALAASERAGPSPREVFRVDPVIDGAIVATASLGSLVPWLLEEQLIDVRCPCDRSEVNRLDRWAIGLHSDAAAHASQATLYLAMIVPPLADWAVLGTRRALLQDVVVFAETLAVNGAANTLVKFTLQRPIPRAYEGDPAYVREPGSYRAFWSGHTSTTVAALTDVAWTIRLRYGERRWPWLVAAMAGVSVGVERVWGGHHYPSDVLAALVAGAAVGTAVPLLHARRDSPRIALTPLGRGLALVGRF